MDTVQQRAAAKQFVADWTGHGDEKQDAQNFWRQLLQKVFGVEDPEKAISFEYKVKTTRPTRRYLLTDIFTALLF